jgi:serine phosphatase RsbU (regulator of sigma subunit)
LDAEKGIINTAVTAGANLIKALFLHMAITDRAANVLLLFKSSTQSDELQQYLSELGYRCLTVPQAKLKPDWLSQQVIDLVILESGAFDLSGLERLEAEAHGYLPLIVICPQIDDTLLDAYSNAHVDGYLTTPVNLRLLVSSIKAALSVRELYSEHIEQRNLLREYSRQSDLEREIVARIYGTVLESHLLHTELVRCTLSPLALFNGDFLLVEKTPDNRLYMLLGDFPGRGLSAAIGAVPVADIFYRLTRKGSSLPSIVQAINVKLHKFLPADMFLAASAVALNPDSRSLSFIGCGLAGNWILNTTDGRYSKVESNNVLLGIGEDIDPIVQNFTVDAHHRVYMTAGAVYEIEDSGDEVFDVESIVELINANPDDSIAAIQHQWLEHEHHYGRNGDISLVELTCDVEHFSKSPNVQLTHFAKATHWNSMMEFDIDALRTVNPISDIVNSLMEIRGLQRCRETIFIIVSELFTNALDHGLLDLNSDMKATPEGFSEFYRLRDERLHNLQRGCIKLSFKYTVFEHGGRLTIGVNDSGDGFDWKSIRQPLKENERFCGRGLGLVQSLCSRLRFHGNGNRVTAVFDWSV